ncbi:phage integrase SAM-like domain-containing protein [Flavobacterium acetivorans]|uniref:phage integrase SAM-like domain-containing protein n=1 Tax=Flavobacterium acetivorans TaxID=2893883 RepID=UPI001E4EB20F|nr:phage integrase SAM-like domain-containing protein [Flavobacterium sp. F-29]UFH34642.1 phage integrase SAM-like domain-containing protein [Flavobacterium sp. F-29]
MKDQSDEVRSINSYLDMMRSKVWSTEMNLMHQEEEISIENFQTILLEKNRVDRMLFPIFQDHNNKMKKLTGKKYAAGTLQRFEVTLNHIQNFLIWKYKISDIKIDKIDHAMINELEFYLRSVRNCSNNTKEKYIWNFRKIIKICLNNDWLDKNPFSRYEGKVYEIDKEFLTEEEIQKIYARAPGTSARHIYILLFYGLGEKTGQIDQ